MISAIYGNSVLYYNMMKNFLSEKINAWEFRQKYWRQRNEDLDKNKASGYSDGYSDKIKNLKGKEKIFEEEYSDLLYRKAWSDSCSDILIQYERGIKELDIKGEMVFMGIWHFIDEYIREYAPSDSAYFDPEMDVDEKTLRNRVQAVFGVLERNKDRWM
ncbi:hypothetical protein MIDIC_240074 [Alphaproteobacteria bacterium]